MTQRSVQRIEDMLRAGAPAARREAPPALHRDIVRALAAQPSSATDRASLEPRSRTDRWRAWRSRSQQTLAAATVLFAIGVWCFAFLREQPDGHAFTAPVDAAVEAEPRVPQSDALFALENAASREALTQVAGAAPTAVRSAIDGALLTEVDNIAHDADRAAHFLLGRLPLVLVTRSDDSAR